MKKLSRLFVASLSLTWAAVLGGCLLWGGLFAQGCGPNDPESPNCATGQRICVGDEIRVCNANLTGYDFEFRCPTGTCRQGQAQCVESSGGAAGGPGGQAGAGQGGKGGGSSGESSSGKGGVSEGEPGGAGQGGAGQGGAGAGSGGAGAPGCPEGQAKCGELCVSTQTSEQHCGSCGNACPAAQICQQGDCACASGTPCGEQCINTQSDAKNCGACGNACKADEVCNTGTCIKDCGALAKCGNDCADTQQDKAHCGGCGKACGAELVCSGGECVCPAGLTMCGGKCIDTMTDPNNCGGCGSTDTGDPHVCPSSSDTTENGVCTAGFCSKCVIDYYQVSGGFSSITLDMTSVKDGFLPSGSTCASNCNNVFGATCPNMNPQKKVRAEFHGGVAHDPGAQLATRRLRLHTFQDDDGLPYAESTAPSSKQVDISSKTYPVPQAALGSPTNSVKARISYYSCQIGGNPDACTIQLNSAQELGGPTKLSRIVILETP